MTEHAYYWTGHVSSPVPGVTLATVLTVSTRHRPNVDEDLSPWSWGGLPAVGIEWFYAYEEDPSWDDAQMPHWLYAICTVARQKYNANWVLLDPAGDILSDFPVFDH